MRTLINPLLGFLSGQRQNASQASNHLDILRETSKDTFADICQNLELVEKEAMANEEVIKKLKTNRNLSKNLTILTESTKTEILKSMNRTGEIQETILQLNNLSSIANDIQNFLQRHLDVEKKRKQDTSRILKCPESRSQPPQINIHFKRGELAELVQVFVENKAAAFQESLNGIKQGNHPVWACLTFAIMLGPGLVVCFYMLTTGFLRNVTPIDECPKWFQRKLFILGIITTVIFPVGILLTQIFEIFIVWLASINTDVSQKKDYENMLKTIRFITQVEAAIEAFFESVPQLVLQTYIIAAMKEATGTQIITITFSMVMLAKTTIFYDLMYNSTEVDRRRHKRPLMKTAKYLLAVLPLYVTSAIFKVSIVSINLIFVIISKVGSMSIFAMYFGIWTGLMLGPLTIVFFVVTRKLGFDITNGVILSLTNLSVVCERSSHKFHMFSQVCVGPTFSSRGVSDSRFKFILISSALSLVIFSSGLGEQSSVSSLQIHSSPHSGPLQTSSSRCASLPIQHESWGSVQQLLEEHILQTDKAA